MNRRQKATVLWVAAGVPLAVGAVAGLALSFGNVVDVVRPIVGDDLAPVFPLVWDVVLFGAALAYLATAYAGKPRQMWRVISQGGVVGTVLVNATAAHDLRSMVVHLSGPLAWAVLVEAGASQLRADYRAKNRDVLGESIPLRLWVWSPRESAATWLRMARRVEGEQAAARLDVGLHTAAVEALRLAVPGRSGRRVRGIVVRQLRAGSLPPVAVLKAAGWLDTDQAADPGQRVLRAALGAALGQGQGGAATGAVAPVEVEVSVIADTDGQATEPVAGEPVQPEGDPEPVVVQPAPVPVRTLHAVHPDPEPAPVPGGRTAQALLPQVQEAIRRRHLDPEPSAEAIRRHLQCAPKTARELRDLIRTA